MSAESLAEPSPKKGTSELEKKKTNKKQSELAAEEEQEVEVIKEEKESMPPPPRMKQRVKMETKKSNPHPTTLETTTKFFPFISGAIF